MFIQPDIKPLLTQRDNSALPVIASAASTAAVAPFGHPVRGIGQRPRPLPSCPATIRRGRSVGGVAPTTPPVIVVSGIPVGWGVVAGVPVGRVVPGVPVFSVHGRRRPAVAVAIVVVTTIASSAESTSTLHLSALIAMAQIAPRSRRPWAASA